MTITTLKPLQLPTSTSPQQLVRGVQPGVYTTAVIRPDRQVLSWAEHISRLGVSMQLLAASLSGSRPARSVDLSQLSAEILPDLSACVKCWQMARQKSWGIDLYMSAVIVLQLGSIDNK